ncbi:transcription factor E4F1 [Eucyclogobius newberryi]|uniref:transcription factor E4F1 n=1 Tax=Eucyclogobius newberryi TaxID=166745 RepID=UPI003B5BB86D
MSVKNDNTAETETEETKNGNETITIHTSLGDEDEDVHKCGRCQAEFTTLDAFIQHKLHKNCKRDASNSQEAVESNRSFSDMKTLENDNCLSPGQRRKTSSHKATSKSHRTEKSVPVSGVESDKNENGSNSRYLCGECEKTFKTLNILRTHLKTHTEEKNFKCELCDTSFRTKGSLIRHNRRHTDERPYRCNLCGQSFRESGALTRHLKSLTPCTEKIRFVQYKEILVSKDGARKGVESDHDSTTEPQEVIVVQQQPSEENEDVGTQTAVVNVVEVGSQEVLHQVHITMAVDEMTQEQQVMVEQSQAEALAAAAAAGDSLICQAIINSGIALETEETVVEETSQEPEGITKDISVCPEIAENFTEIHVKDELIEIDVEDTDEGEGDGDEKKTKFHKCPYCDRTFKGISYLRFHVKGHMGYKPFKCTICQKDYLSGYLLKKHMEHHVSERRYKCGECGKLYKTIGHVREHMRAHSDERPHHCNKCDRGYKTKNALQVHQRTHGDEKPFVCQFCTRSFREKGSLVRHIRHHTGEKPYKCLKCGRGFAEHGTLNRHMRAKGGCQKEATATMISEDPHAVLVEFSSVVADTQEYIIKTQTEAEEGQGEQVALFQDDQSEVGSHIMKVVQQIVSQSHGAGTGSPQIIVRNVGANEEGLSISDCGDTITIATPESLTEQVAMTLASAINDGTLLGTTGTVETPEGTVTLVTTPQDMEEGVQIVQQQQEEYVLNPEIEIQTFVV